MLEVKLGRHRGQFVAVWRNEAGRRHRHSLGTSDRELARTRLAAFETHLASKSPTGELTVGAIFQAYLKDREEDEKSTTRMRHAWKRLGPTFGHMRPNDITKKTSLEYIKARRAVAGDGTIWTELSYLRAALKFAVRSKWLTAAPYIKVPTKPAPREHHLSRDEAKRLLDAAAMPHVKLFIRLALATAGRAGAVLGLTWDRVDLEKRRIDLRDPDRPVTRKGRARVPINDTLLEALNEARRGATSPYVIEWGGEQVLSVKKGVGAAARRASVKCSPHVLRHTAAVWMAEEGIAIEKIAQYLGHDDSRTTERVYARFAPEHLRDAARTLDL